MIDYLSLTEKDHTFINGIPCFGNESDGDHFDEEILLSLQNGVFASNFHRNNLLVNTSSGFLLDEIIKNESYIIDLASGPGMGLVSSLMQLHPDFDALITDANLNILKGWKKYLDAKEKVSNLSMAQFSLFELPFKNESVKAFSSFIGVSSTRGGTEGYDKALSEIYRCLDNGGRFYTVENEWSDIPLILDLFEKMGKEPWSVFLGEQLSWHDRFVKNGFDILYEEEYVDMPLLRNDNELGEAAYKYGVSISLKAKAYIVRKR